MSAQTFWTPYRFILISVLFSLGTYLIFLPDSKEDSKAHTEMIRIDGSSTVFPITEAVAEEFGFKHPDIRVTIGVSGTGGGFKKFCTGETEINNASRTMRGREKGLAEKNGIKYFEFPVAYDGISVVVNRENDWVDSLTVEELRKIWEPDSQVLTWKDVRQEWPDREIRLYGPGTDSGTFDYFTKVICGRSQASRSDFTKSEDDNVLIKGIVGDRDSLGYFGFAYFDANKQSIRAVPIVDQGEPVSPNKISINDGSYSPLSRPVFIYVNEESLKREAVQKFVMFYLKNAATLSEDVGYVSLPKTEYNEITALVEQVPSE